MTRSEWKAAARARLGGGIFKDQWLMGVVFCLVVSAIVGAAGSILPGVGALVVTGPMLYAQKYAFLAQAREGRGIDLNDLFRGFRDDFGGTLLISLLSGLFIFLGACCFSSPASSRPTPTPWSTTSRPTTPNTAGGNVWTRASA